MPQLAVVSFPALADEDRRWVESIRAKHDPQAGRLAAHFTLVFPVEAPTAAIATEVTSVARSVAPIQFVVRYAMAARDADGRGGHVFLVADEGAAEIVSMHNLLYAGQLKPHLRTDIPFVPHITVAGNQNFGACQALAEEIDDELRTLRGSLDSLEVLDVGGATIASAGRFVLNGG
ncbi:MAG: 2'-5' RNA ligase family protein [Acidobacteriota bacterium]